MAGRWGDLVLGRDKAMRERVTFTLLAAGVKLLWAGVYVISVWAGQMSMAGMAFMLTFYGISIVGFYAWLRSGKTGAGDPGFVLPQVLLGSVSATCACVLAPATVRPALLQTLCLCQAFGLLGLDPRRLAISGAAAIVLVLGLFGFALTGRLPGFDSSFDGPLMVLTCLELAAMTGIVMRHARRRMALKTQKLQLEVALAGVRELLTRDVLTGLINRRHMQTLLDDEHARGLRSGAPFAVALLDLDHFKRINDTHGHHVGDEVLRRFAELAAAEMRSTDTVARWGGEEFLVLMPEAGDDATAQRGLDRLRDRLGATGMTLAAPGLRVAFSGGFARHVAPESVAEVLARADAALYAAKASGRGCVVAASETEAFVDRNSVRASDVSRLRCAIR